MGMIDLGHITNIHVMETYAITLLVLQHCTHEI